MRAKSILLLVIALGCGVVASVAVSQVLTDQNANEPQTVGILVTTKDIAPMSKLTAESFRIEQWPADRVPVGALTNPAQADGKYTKQRMFASEPVLEAKISEKGRDMQVKAGYRVFDMKVDDANGGSGYIGPGDRVDINGFFEKGNRFPVSKSMTVMKNLEVMSVDGVATRDPEAPLKRAGTIQLLIKASQYEALHLASRLGTLTPTLRASDAEDDSGEDDGDAFKAFLAEADAIKQERAAPSEQPLTTNYASFAPPERHEIVVMTPKGKTVYRFTDNNSLPEKVDPLAEASRGPVYNYTPYPTSPPPSFPNGSKPVTPSSRSTKSASSVKKDSNQIVSNPAVPVDPEDLVQPNLVFDTNTGTWQSGNFKATDGSNK